jgi:hypothetical protein
MLLFIDLFVLTERIFDKIVVSTTDYKVQKLCTKIELLL